MDDPLRAYATLTLGLGGTVFVRQGPYAPGVFRFSVQFTIQGTHLVLPTVFFPPILIHPLVEVRFLCLTQPATGRLSMLPYLGFAAQRDWTTHPENATFLTCLTHYLHACFSVDVCAALKEQWTLNEHMWDLFHTDRAMFDRLAAQSASLSQSALALYDRQSGSGLPGDLDVACPASQALDTPTSIMPFEELAPEEVARICRDLVEP